MPAPKIIVVEDDRIISIEIKDMLENFGYNVISVVSYGEDAVTEALEKKPDLMLMDIRLAGKMDGIEAAEQINLKLSIPIIYLTSYSDQVTLKRAKKTNPMDYVLKPFVNLELHGCIENALKKHKKRTIKSK